MDQQPGRRQPARGQGRGPGRAPGRSAGGPRPDDSAEEQPNVVRPFVRHAEKAQKHQRQEDQRRQGRSTPVADVAEFAEFADQRPEAERSSLVPNPLPAPRAVARQIGPGEHVPMPAPPRPMSDLTTTMPILSVPIDDGGDHSAPPGEPGHFHDDGEFGRHRGGGRATRLKAAGILVGVVVAGAAVAGTFAGGSGKSSTPRAGGDATTTGAVPTSDAAVPDPPGDSGATASSRPSHSPTATPTPTRSTHTSSPKPSTSASTTVNNSPAMVSRPSSAASTPSTAASSTPPTTPSTSAPPAFTPLKPGDSGPAVTKLQSDLKAAGYDYDFDKGNYDGLTESAVWDFQTRHRGTGQADGWGNYGVATDKALQAAVSGTGG